MPKVSVIIPVFNGEQHIAQAIESVLNQTFQDFEIVITDDGSTDRTEDEVRRFNDPRIRLLRFDGNRGVASATNNSVAAAVGELIAIIDSDNVFLPQKLERQIDFLSREPEIGAVFTKVRLIDDEGRPIQDEAHPYLKLFEEPNRTRQEWLRHFFFKGNCLCHPSAVIRRQCYEDIGFYDSRLSQLLDLDLWIRLCQRFEIFILPDVLLDFRIRNDDSNLSGQSNEALARHDWQASRVLDRYLGISDTQELLRVFPEVNRFGEVLDAELIPFYLAILAFEGNYTPAKVWALNTLHELLGTPAREKLKSLAGFEEIDFIRLTADPDVFDLGRRIRQQERQIHNLERLSHELSEIVHRQRRRLSEMEESMSWRLTRPLRLLRTWPGVTGWWGQAERRARRFPLSGIHLECDRLSYSADSIEVSGWAISDQGISRVEIYLNGTLLGHASYGLDRNDVERAFPKLKESGRSGFHFQADLRAQALADQGKVKITVRAVDQLNRTREVILPALSEDQPDERATSVADS